MLRCLFLSNVSDYYGAAIHLGIYSTANITNCTFVDNQVNMDYGAAITTSMESRVEIINTIITNTRNGVSVKPLDTTPITITHSDFYGNELGDWNGYIAELANRYGNISADPMFVDSLNNDFHLLYGSPCIDSGSDQTNPDPDGSPPDMGALYFDHNASVFGTGELLLSESPVLYQNYPNPFNSSTKIHFYLPESQRVRLEIFNSIGRRIDIIMDQQKEKGVYLVEWNAEGCSSGTYFMHLTCDGKVLSRKTLLIK